MNAKNVRHGIQAMFILVARSRSFILFCGMNKFGTASQAKCLNIGSKNVHRSGLLTCKPGISLFPGLPVGGPTYILKPR